MEDMDMSQKLLPSGHFLEIFMPYRGDEARMLNVLRKAVELNFYRGVELGVFFDRYNRMYVREILETNRLNGTTFATPYLKDQKLSLSDLDGDRRRKAVELVKQLAGYVADSGYTNLGVCSGDDPGDAKRAEAKKVLENSMIEAAGYCKTLGLNLTLEPLDRYAYKKQLIGPIRESMLWFAPVHEACPNAYIHWDSAHEALSKTDLMQSIELASPYIAQFHLCNAILEEDHPCFGDLHMDCGVAPDFKMEGFLTPAVGAKILEKIASYDKPAGVKNVYVSVEVLGHPGDDLWLKERNSREFLCKCFELAGMAI
ncbi:MAG: sugar phosphate isomerase/epimerase [Ruminococcaceae bacterium]|nr:sugar phosphate isomerase/epimerase [Oscillospiraceae bacterium]